MLMLAIWGLLVVFGFAGFVVLMELNRNKPTHEEGISFEGSFRKEMLRRGYQTDCKVCPSDGWYLFRDLKEENHKTGCMWAQEKNRSGFYAKEGEVRFRRHDK